jgi:hypothetical protein
MHPAVHTDHVSVLPNTQLAFFAVPLTVPKLTGNSLKLGGPLDNGIPIPVPAPKAPPVVVHLPVHLVVRAPVPVPVAAPVPAPAPAPAAVPQADSTSVNTADWDCIRRHESGDNYAEHGGGAYQFEIGTWHSITGLAGSAQDYPAATQDAAALKLHAERGWEPWSTRYVCGL